MRLTTILFAKKPKSKHILVAVESLVSGHKVSIVRERLGEKLEFMAFDPFVNAEVLYREKKKMRSVRNWDGRKPGYYDQFVQ